MRFSKVLRFQFGNRLIALKILFYNSPLHTYYGITNQTYDGYFIPFWDFVEDVSLLHVREALKDVRYSGLSDIYIFQTVPKASYRAIAFDLLTWKEYISLLSLTDLVDMQYFKHTAWRGFAVLRLTEKDGTKNTLVEHLLGESDTVKSIDHWQFFSSLYPEMDKPIVRVHKPRLTFSNYESLR